MGKNLGTDLRKFMDKRLRLTLNKGRKIEGILRGFDVYMNIVVDETVAVMDGAPMGMVVIRGNAVEMMEALERA
ncbi:small nuclear ribonucleoprotein SmG [Thecamonas trahens ATCC 50062]|uniref:Sm protein G n=1 Tax=Thecamonas trahens ATCC 50062 TaxID=461836 RepID=A0A0L0D9G4_THETB|nr:small nuclear ribonucleoprotein SmG [Thecamonas trahens ATCC 50062]KNC47943.1 small nuclear ribonucleoprotein SmG [Thecamonas trahens ATCC 50062]|eukprot:XP_013758962.1 small nuclear ribonucleoprotein SmG [Thecamonas trahens ATCC 50062]